MMSILKGIFNLIFAYKTEVVKGKNPLYSKTLYVNILSLLGVILAKYFDFHLTAEEVAAMMVVINGFMRLISKGSVGFYKDSSSIDAEDPNIVDVDTAK